MGARMGAAFEAAAIVWQQGERLRITSVSVEDSIVFCMICAASWQLSASLLFGGCVVVFGVMLVACLSSDSSFWSFLVPGRGVLNLVDSSEIRTPT